MPFHFWAPDTYVGAPVPVAAYLSVVSKAAGFVGLALLLTVRLRAVRRRVGDRSWRCSPRPTMTVGNLVALRQRQAVRLLAWSSVAQAGYMLVPLGAAGVGRRRRGAAGDGRLRLAYARDEPRRLRGGDAGRAAPAGQPARRLPRRWAAPSR